LSSKEVQPGTFFIDEASYCKDGMEVATNRYEVDEKCWMLSLLKK